MNHTYTNDLIEQLSRGKKTRGNLTAIREDEKEIVKELQRAVPFRLPDQGKLFGERDVGASMYDKYGFVFENFKLPYEEIVLEHYTSPLNRVPGEKNYIKYDATVLHLKELEDGWVKGRIFFRNTKSRRWDITNFGFKAKPKLEEKALESVPVFETRGSDVYYQQQGLSAFRNDIECELTTLVEFLAILHCSNVEMETKKSTKEARTKRAAQGKKPLLSYKTLVIPGRGGSGSMGDGTHSSPRTHLRRGHIRQLASGKKVWVNACMVNRNSEKGMVVKDYLVQ